MRSGETINLMTLGGLALAVGILVDDATVTIENINRHLEEGLDVEPAIVAGARQILLPAFVSMLSICIVFVPMFLLSGVARYLFVPDGRGRGVRDGRPPSCSPVPWCSRWRSTGCAPPRRSMPRRATPGPSSARSCASRRLSSAPAGATGRCSRRHCATAAASSRRSSPCAAASLLIYPGARTQLLSRGGRRPDQAARARPDRACGWRTRRALSIASRRRSAG